jgi:ADP-heptose:LPS heptosyltransferase
LLIGAKSRLSAIDEPSNFFQRVAYTETLKTSLLDISWVKRHLKMLNLFLDIPEDNLPSMLIKADSKLDSEAIKLLSDHQIICHLGTSQQKKEWPISRWAEFYQLASNEGYKLAFSAGINQREQNLIFELRKLAPKIFILPSQKSLAMYLAILNQARMVISGDTGPLHFAAGLGRKVIGLYAVADSVNHSAPIYKPNQVIIGSSCKCIGELAHFPTCQSTTSCMNSISAEQVFKLLKECCPLKTLNQ